MHIFHTVNCGLYLKHKKIEILIDFLHKGKNVGFSDTPDIVLNKLKTPFGSNHRIFLFTHEHEDHFDEDMLTQLCDFCPDSLIFSPDLYRNIDFIEICSDIKKFRIDNIDIFAIKSVHDGDMFSDIPHNSFLIKTEKVWTFVAGDGILTAQHISLIKKYCTRKIDIAFLNVYQASSSAAFSFAEELNIKNVFLYHLPFHSDDIFFYNRQADSVLNKWPDRLPPLRMIKHMSYIKTNGDDL